MHLLALMIEADLQFVLGLGGGLHVQVGIGVDLRKGLGEVGENEGIRVIGREKFASHLHQVGVVALLMETAAGAAAIPARRATRIDPVTALGAE